MVIVHVEMSRPYSENCFYCNTCSLTSEQVTQHVSLVIADAEAEISRRSPSYVANCKFMINMPKKGDATLPYCYLWVTNKEVYRMIIGLNFDGRPIATRELNEEANEEPKEETKTARGWLLRDVDWSDTSTTEFTKYVPLSNPHFRINPVSIDRVGKAFVEGKLFCSTPLPEQYLSERLHTLFQPFVTSGYLTVTRYANKASVTFSNKDDAYFALCMLRKVRDGDLELSFNYCKAR